MFWQFRYARNTLVASIPGYQRLRKLKRLVFPYDASLDMWTLEQGLQMIEMLRRTGAKIEGASVLELGSGWKPVIPLLFRAAGAGRVILTDSEQLLDARLLAETARLLSMEADQISVRLRVAPGAVRSALDANSSGDLEKCAAKLGLVYMAPTDARDLPLSKGDIDIIISRAVLEHIPRTILLQIFREFARLLAPASGYMCHIVDNSDHWAHHDKRLSMLNFLRYSEKRWTWFARNPLDFMNRMRHSEYVSLLAASGFDMVLDESTPDPTALRDVERLPISSEFNKFSREDLATLTSKLVVTRRHDNPNVLAER